MINLPVLLMVAITALPASGSAPAAETAREMVRIPAGTYNPHYSRGGDRVAVSGFRIDRYPVTKAEFARFVTERPNWRRSAIRPLFAGRGYLADWRSDLDIAGDGALPVTNVSWFAAKAFCENEGKRLPTLDEWEYVAAASETTRDASGDRAFLQRLVEASTRPGLGRHRIGSGFRNAYGVHDLHGVVWEWVLDFNNALVPDDSRASPEAHDRQLYCAAAGVRATNPSNYAAFLRFAMRSGLDGRSTVSTVGFRCAGGA